MNKLPHVCIVICSIRKQRRAREVVGVGHKKEGSVVVFVEANLACSATTTTRLVRRYHRTPQGASQSLHSMDTEPGHTSESAGNAFPWSTFSYEDLVGDTRHFREVQRVSGLERSAKSLFELIWEHEEAGLPLIIGDLHLEKAWDSSLLAPEWLLQNLPDTSG